jgi:hypothetical protein
MFGCDDAVHNASWNGMLEARWRQRKSLKIAGTSIVRKVSGEMGDGRACDVHFYSSSACFIKFEVRTIIGYSVNLEF